MTYEKLVSELDDWHELRFFFDGSKEEIYLFNLDTSDEETIHPNVFRKLEKNYRVQRIVYGMDGSKECGWYEVSEREN